MKFSVVIPTYNRGDIIRKSLDSVLNQKYTNWEIIVVDNCSTDDTAEVMKEYTVNGKVKYVINDKNYERSYSRNKGMQMATGDYVTLLDSDDILYEDCLQNAVEYIHSHPESVFFHCCFDVLDEEYKLMKRLKFPPVNDPFKAIAKGNFISNIGVFYKKELLGKVKFDETPILIGIEDYDFVLNTLLLTGKVGRIDKYCCGIYNHSGRSVHLEEWERTNKRVQYFLEKQFSNPLFQTRMGHYRKLFMAHVDLYLVGFCAARKMTGKSVYYILSSVRNYPLIVTELKFWKHIFVTLKRMF